MVGGFYSPMDKTAVFQTIVERVEQVWQAAVAAAEQARETATHTESVAKTKYDTFGLEASYLAHGQSKRVMELAATLEDFKALPLADFDEDTEIEMSALVHLVSEAGVARWIFVGPGAGGATCHYNDVDNGDIEIVVVTPDAPLGKKLVGKMVGDEVVFAVQGEVGVFEIESVY